MATAGTYVEDLIQYWGNVGRVFTTRLQKASSDARKCEYALNRLFSDGVALWAEGFDAWIAEWVTGVADRGSYLQKLGPRWEALRFQQTFTPLPGTP